jgi:hypothetical protein
MASYWCDDERDTTFRAVHSAHVNVDTNEDMGRIYRDIIKDIEKQKTNLLWNEVEYVNYEFERINYEYLEDSGTFDVESDEFSHADEVNSNCLDALVKNQTAYT